MTRSLVNRFLRSGYLQIPFVKADIYSHCDTLVTLVIHSTLLILLFLLWPHSRLSISSPGCTVVDRLADNSHLKTHIDCRLVLLLFLLNLSPSRLRRNFLVFSFCFNLVAAFYCPTQLDILCFCATIPVHFMSPIAPY